MIPNKSWCIISRLHIERLPQSHMFMYTMRAAFLCLNQAQLSLMGRTWQHSRLRLWIHSLNWLPDGKWYTGFAWSASKAKKDSIFIYMTTAAFWCLNQAQLSLMGRTRQHTRLRLWIHSWNWLPDGKRQLEMLLRQWFITQRNWIAREMTGMQDSLTPLLKNPVSHSHDYLTNYSLVSAEYMSERMHKYYCIRRSPQSFFVLGVNALSHNDSTTLIDDMIPKYSNMFEVTV